MTDTVPAAFIVAVWPEIDRFDELPLVKVTLVPVPLAVLLAGMEFREIQSIISLQVSLADPLNPLRV